MRTLRSEVQRLIRECPDDPRVVLLPNGLTWMHHAAGEITQRGRPRGRPNRPPCRRRPTLARVLEEPATGTPDPAVSESPNNRP